LNRKLLLLNVVLAATAIYAGFQFHRQWTAAKAREAARLHVQTPAAPAPPLPAMPQQPVLQPVSYIDVANKDLFDPSRTPNVVKELPPPPPPPPPVPPLPAYYGMMNLGDGYFAVMSTAGSSKQEEVRAGQMIGEFKLIAFNAKEITLDFQGQTIHQRTDEAPRQNNYAAAAGGAMPSIPSAANPTQNAPISTGDKGPGDDRGATRGCQPGDTSPAGTVRDGYVKVVRASPFGSSCFWEAGK
jgi:hypothetical protein